MITIRINLPTALVTTIVLIFTLKAQRGVLAVEQRNSTDANQESPLRHLTPTQSSAIPVSPSIATLAVNSGSIASSSFSPPFTSAPSLLVSQPHNTARDEIYIDDEGIEGSGGRGEIHDDLEKEPEYSGSGFGPDDEDSTSLTTHQRKKGNGGYKSTNTGSGGYKSSNSKNNSQEPEPDSKTNKQPDKNLTNEDDLETGSGDKDIDSEDDNDNDDDDDDDLDETILPPEEEDTGRSGSIQNPNINKSDLNKDKVDEDEDDLTTTIDEKIEKTDDISIDKHNPDLDSSVIGGEGNEIDLDQSNTVTGKPSSAIEPNHIPSGNEVFIMDNRGEDRTASFFAQPGILAAVIGGAVVGLLCAILVVMFIVYRMRKKDEGSYALDEPKRSPAINSYAKNANNREFYA